MSLVFLDVETTGLDPDVHEVWEIDEYELTITRGEPS